MTCNAATQIIIATFIRFDRDIIKHRQDSRVNTGITNSNKHVYHKANGCALVLCPRSARLCRLCLFIIHLSIMSRYEHSCTIRVHKSTLLYSIENGNETDA